jgi:hypothetical protein
MVDKGFEVHSTGKDPHFEMMVNVEQTHLFSNWLVIRLAFIVAIVLIVMYCSASLVKQFRFVPLLLFGAWLLIIIMAGTSKINVHPDEYVHMNASSYYQDNWLPPLYENPEIRKTYSLYGISKLNDTEMFYLLAGKYEKMLTAFRMSEVFSKRLLNVTLFGLIFLFTIRNRRARLVAIPLLLSPQIWYVFSYCNSDALAVTVAFFTGCQLVDSDGLLQRYLKGSSWKISIVSVVTMGVLFGLLFLLKKNYYPYIAFFYFCAGLKLFFTEEYYWERRQAFFRFCLITILGLAIFGARSGLDFHVNGMDRQQKLVTLQEDLAHDNYKPSTPLDKKIHSLHLKDRGTTLKDMFYTYHWGEQTFQSSFGVFEYFTITASTTYYNLVRYSGIILAGFVFCSILLRGGWLGSTMLLGATGLSVALIGASAYLSWTVDFQPQGRYLFPIVAMFGIVYGLYHKHVNAQLLTFGVVCMYVLACYNFIFNGLVHIPKIPI